MTIGNRIKGARKAAGLTQAQLAEKCGVATITIQQYERSKREPRFEQLQVIADALHIHVGELLGLEKIDNYFWGKRADPQEEERILSAIFHRNSSVHKAVSEVKARLNTYMDMLNDEGQQKAVERVEELTEIPKYGKFWGKEILDQIDCPIGQIEEYRAKGYEIYTISYFVNGTGEGTATMVKTAPTASPEDE